MSLALGSASTPLAPLSTLCRWSRSQAEVLLKLLHVVAVAWSMLRESHGESYAMLPMQRSPRTVRKLRHCLPATAGRRHVPVGWLRGRIALPMRGSGDGLGSIPFGECWLVRDRMDLALDHAHQRHIVLVVGDVIETDVSTVPALLVAGFDAIAVESGSATLALLRTGVDPCVLVIDADLTDMDGWELWRRVSARKGTRRPAAVFVSTDPVDATRARLARIGEFIQKPIANDRLIEIVARHCPHRFSWTPKGLARWLRRAVHRHSIQALKGEAC